MLNKILAPLDSSDLAQRVLPHAQALAKAFQGEVTLLHVLEMEHRGDATQIDPISWQMRRAEAQSYLNAVAEAWQGGDVGLENVLLEGSAADAILDYVEKNEPDLIVLSSHGQSGLTQWSLSSVAQKIIYGAYKSFLLVRARQAEPAERPDVHYQRIMVPLDGSKRAEYVLPLAVQLAQAQGARLLLVHAISQPDLVPQQPLSAEDMELIERVMHRNRSAAATYLKQLQARLGCESETRLLVGRNDADALLESLDSDEVDLLILNAHGHSGEGLRPYGSVVSSLIANGSSHLLVVQDLPQHALRPAHAQSQAQLPLRNGANNGGLSHPVAYG
ncbi:MAG: universal stress protein [Candidatus Promineifilaceae bacterium]